MNSIYTLLKHEVLCLFFMLRFYTVNWNWTEVSTWNRTGLNASKKHPMLSQHQCDPSLIFLHLSFTAENKRRYRTRMCWILNMTGNHACLLHFKTHVMECFEKKMAFPEKLLNISQWILCSISPKYCRTFWHTTSPKIDGK